MKTLIKLGFVLIVGLLLPGCKSLTLDSESFTREGRCIKINIIRDNNFDIEGCLDFVSAEEGSIVVIPYIEDEIDEALEEE